ncbi:MAG: zf-HC2 domain-containing protein, partial [Endomicrobiia bacterium]|nr:zf-HC2 domain-containing protein [Endomicrobiia bacterium]
MKCEKWRIMLSVAEDSELDGRDSAVLAAHVAECRDCREFADSLRAIRAELSKDSEPLAPPEFFETRLAGRIASEKSRRAS